MNTLTRRQCQVLNFIRAELATGRQSPSLRVIAEHLGVTSASAFGHVSALECKGYVQRVGNHLQLRDRAGGESGQIR
jgi:DNA-binding MarR family transcriptional regulator